MVRIYSLSDLEHTLPKLWNLIDSGASFDGFSDLCRQVLGLVSAQSEVDQSGRIYDSAQKSHIHDNGFLKLHIYETSDQRFRLRLHVWHPVSMASDANVHEHRYDFASYIVAGAVEQIRWKPNPDGKVFRSFVYRPRNEEGHYQLVRLGDERLAPEPIETYLAGDSYYLHRDVFHITRAAGDSPSVTMCLQDRQALKTEALTYSTFHPDEAEIVEAPPLSVAEYMDAVRQVVKAHMSHVEAASGT